VGLAVPQNSGSILRVHGSRLDHQGNPEPARCTRSTKDNSAGLAPQQSHIPQLCLIHSGCHLRLRVFSGSGRSEAFLLGVQLSLFSSKDSPARISLQRASCSMGQMQGLDPGAGPASLSCL